jgi:Flp pilus assembly protein TadG
VLESSERGAAAVEFAILLPLLLMLVLGTIEFGRAYNAQITLTNAARDGVRVMAIANDPTGAKTAAKNAAASVSTTIPPPTSR